jgi:hypothetical protein
MSEPLQLNIPTKKKLESTFVHFDSERKVSISVSKNGDLMFSDEFVTDWVTLSDMKSNKDFDINYITTLYVETSASQQILLNRFGEYQDILDNITTVNNVKNLIETINTSADYLEDNYIKKIYWRLPILPCVVINGANIQFNYLYPDVIVTPFPLFIGGFYTTCSGSVVLTPNSTSWIYAEKDSSDIKNINKTSSLKYI